MDLSTEYLGLKLANPLVPSASPLSRSLDTARQLEDAGAAAIVMYSLFEEELIHEEEMMSRFLYDQDIGHAEADSFLPEPVEHDYKTGLEQYLEQLGKLKEHLDIPVIASLNGITPSGWIDYGKELQEAGADALELNVYYIAANLEESSQAVEQRYIDLLKELRTHVTLPIAMKLSPHFSSLGHFVKQLETAGANGIALFNRFYQPDIDPHSLQVAPALHLSTSQEARIAARWIAILHGRVKLTLAATGGIHTTNDALKLLLAGADVTHLCSALLEKGPKHIGKILAGITRWLDEHGYESVAQIKGIVSYRHAKDPATFERANYLQVLDSYTPSAGILR